MISNLIIEEKINFLFNCVDNNNNCDLNEINNVVDEVKKIFEVEKFYVILFEKYAIKNKNKNLFSIIIEILIKKLILNEEISENDFKFKNILNIFPFLLENLILTKKNVEIIYKNLSNLYFNNNILNSKILLKYLLLLEAIFKKPEKKTKIKEPKNFFYFFNESFFEIDLKENSIEIPEKGIIISIFLKLINEQETKKNKKIISFTNENEEEFSFILNKNELKLFNNKLNEIYENKNSIQIEFNKIFLFNIFFNKNQIKLFINNEKEFVFENINVGNKINNIKFFNNCAGICSCILILNCKKIYANFKKINDFLTKEFEIGINKKNYITKFTQNIITLEDIYAIYLPFSYENKINDFNYEIEEFLNKNQSLFLKGNFNGIHNFICNIKNIINLGGIINLLPIFEMIMINIEKLKENLLEILKTFLKIIENIFINDKKNVDFEKKNFIEILSLFLENFPKELFTLDIINILIKIADSINSNEIKKIFYDNLLLNEKLYFQFNKESQNILIKHLIKIVNEFSIEKIISIISIEKLCLLIKYYDEQKDKKYCCDYHYKSFINNNININYEEFIMNPSIPEISENLSELISNLFLKIEIDKSNLPFVLFKLLLLDVSPCVMKFIIKIFLNLFKSKEFYVRLNIKNFFMSNKNYDFFIHVSKNVLNRCLFDVLVDYIELLTYILKNDTNKITENVQNIINENIIKNFDISNNIKCFFNDEYVNKNIERIYKFLMILFLGKFNFDNNDLIITENDNINNELLIDGIIKLMKLLNVNNKKFLSKFLKDLNKLFLINCKNCFMCYKNNFFIEFILENFINVYLNVIQDDYDKIILDCCNQIFINLYKNSISFLEINEKEIEDSPINILNNLLIFCRKKETEENKEKLNDFIRFIFIQYFYFLKSKTKNNEISIKNKFLLNFITFFAISIDRSIFYCWKDFENFDNFNYEIIKNEFINIVDYDNLKSFYDCLKFIFNLKNIYKKSEINLKEDYNKNLFEKNKKIIKNFIFNKKFRSENLNNLLLLNYVYDENKNMKLNKSILLFILISYDKSKDEKTKIEWLNELINFTLFYIISSCNLFREDLKNYFDVIQNDSFDIIYFCLKMLNKEYLKSENEFKINIKLLLREFFSLLIMINEQINEKNNIQKNKGIFGFFGNKEKINFFDLPVYKLFNNFTKINYNFKELKENNFNNIPEFYLNDPDNLINLHLFNNQDLIKRNYYIFDLQKIKNYLINRLNKNEKKENLIIIDDIENSNHIKYIKNLIFNYYQEIYKYSNSTFLIIKERRNFYKRIKKNLFLWQGMWSNDEDLYNNKYKYKVINHYTKILSRPLLMPILDINYYEPKFSGFNVNNLFIEKNDCHLVNLDIDEIFSKNNLNEKNIENIENKNTFFYDILNNNKYEGNFTNIYLKFSENINLLNEESYFIHYLNSIRELNEPESYLRKFENVYKCCFVKTEHHIKGIFFINKNCVSFKVFINKNEFPDENFDEEHKTCYGSVFNDSHKDKDILNFNIPFNKIKIIFKRRYFQMNNSLEIFTKNLKSYYFKFKNFKDREKCLKDIRKHLKSLKNKTILKKIVLDQVKTEENIGVIVTRNKGGLSKKKKLSNLIKKWQNGLISNFEFLMWMNLYSNRSYSDIFQYPVFPWIFDSYSEKLNLNNDFRDLSLPMGMLECNDKSKERKEYYIEHYESMVEEEENKNENEENLINNRKPFIYGTIFSNATYVSHFLSRIFPYSNMSIEMQGNKFDVVDRLFLSIEKCFEMASTQKSDVRELIPEFYILPEMFENLNKINMGKLENDEFVNNVDIPKWAEKDNYKFVYLKKKYFESEEISLHLNKWIDLIFGFKTRGKDAIVSRNLFFPEAYEIDVEKLNEEEKQIKLKYFEFGAMPKQISCIEFPSKKILNKNIFDKDENKIICSSLFKVNNNNETLLNNFFIIREKQRIIVINKEQDVNVFRINLENIEKKNDSKEKNVGSELNRIKTLDFNNNENNSNNKQNENQIQTGFLDDFHKLSNKFKKFTNTITTKSENKINPINAEKTNSNFLFSKKYNFFEQCKYYNNLKEHKHPPILFLHSVTEQNIITLCQGGFYNSKLVFTNINYGNYNLKIKDKINNLNGYYTFRVSNEPYIITSLCLKEDKEEYLNNEINFFCGNSNGAVFLIEIINLPFKPQFNVLKKIINNSMNINSIFYSKNLYVLGTSSLDGFINLYTIPSFKFFRSIKIDNELFSCDEIFLITSPLPSVIILNYKNKNKEILSYNINGKFLNKVFEERGILSPKIGCDCFFNEYLVYLIENEEKKVIIRDLPYLNIKTEILIKFNDAEIIQIDKNNKYIYIGNKQGNEWIYLK